MQPNCHTPLCIRSCRICLTHRLVEGNGIPDSLLLGENWRREQHTVDALDHSVRSIDVNDCGDRTLHTAAGAAVATLACALAETSLPLGSQGANHEGEVALQEVTLLCAGEVVTGGLVDAGVVECDLAVGLAAVHDRHNFDTLGSVDSGVVAQVVCEQQGWGEWQGSMGQYVISSQEMGSVHKPFINAQLPYSPGAALCSSSAP